MDNKDENDPNGPAELSPVDQTAEIEAPDELAAIGPGDSEKASDETDQEPFARVEPRLDEPRDDFEDPEPQAYAPPDGAQVGSPHPPLPERILRRDPNGPGAGVATGIARYFGIEPVIVQALFVLFTFAAASGILLYIALWLLIPVADTNKKAGVVGVILGVGLIVGGASAGFSVIDIRVGDSLVFWLALIGLGAFLLNQRSDEVSSLGSAVNEIVTTTVRPSPAGGPDPSVAYAPRVASNVGAPSRQSEPSTNWAMPRTDTAYTAATPPEPKQPGPPVTLATIAAGGLAVGILVVVYQIAGWSLSAGLVLGLLLAVCGLGILASAFIGRAPGLIPIAILLSLGVAMASVDNITGISVSSGLGERSYLVTEPADLKNEYDLGIGEVTLNLAALELTEDMHTGVNLGIGSATVIVPRDMTVEVTGRSRMGSVILFGRSQDGTKVELSKTSVPDDADPDAPTLFIEMQVRIGEVEIVHGR